MPLIAQIEQQLQQLLDKEEQLKTSIQLIKEELASLTKDTPEEENWEEFHAPEWCIPIKANVLSFDWEVWMHT